MKAILWILLVLCCGCKTATDRGSYLKKVSDNLSRIKSVSYFVTEVVSPPGDTAKLRKPRESYYKIVMNPLDTLVGSRSAWFMADDTTKAMAVYDGNAHGYVEWNKGCITIDSFQTQMAPFRVVHYPIYSKVNEIIKYALTTKDSIQTKFIDYKDSVFFSLKIFNKHVYFHLKPIVVKNDYIPEDEVSQFDVWIRKSDNMPYKLRSKWHDLTNVETCHNETFNTTQDVAFDARTFYPASFRIVERAEGPETAKADLTGKKAPDWTLKDADGQEFKLTDFKQKVLLIQFTGIGCGPCHQSIPFLKKLVNDYKSKNFAFVSIETWSDDLEDLRMYQDKNEFNFKFLKASDQVKKSYQVAPVPTFLIIDKNKVIKKMMIGYSKESTDREIVENIDKLL